MHVYQQQGIPQYAHWLQHNAAKMWREIVTQKLVTGCDLTSSEKGSGECFTANEPRLSGTQVV